MNAADTFGRIGRRELEARCLAAETMVAQLRDELAMHPDPTLVGWRCAHCGRFNEDDSSTCADCGQDAPTAPRDAVARLADTLRLTRIFDGIRAELQRQNDKHGPVGLASLAIDHGTGGAIAIAQRERERISCGIAFANGQGTWRGLVAKKVAEAFAERETNTLRPRLVRLAATIVRWIEVIDEYAEGDE